MPAIVVTNEFGEYDVQQGMSKLLFDTPASSFPFAIALIFISFQTFC